MVGYFSGGLRLSDRQIQESLRLLFGLDIALGTVANLRKDLGGGLAEPAAEVLEHVREQPAVNVDETTWWGHTTQMWLWTATTPKATAFRISPGRGKWEAQEFLGEDFEGGVVTDRLYSYNWCSKRQLCWSHLIRDFRRIACRGGPPGLLGRGLEELGENVLRDIRRLERGEITRGMMRTYASRIRTEVRALLELGVECGHAKTAGTCKDILKKESLLCSYLSNPAMDAPTTPPSGPSAPQCSGGRLSEGPSRSRGALSPRTS